MTWRRIVRRVDPYQGILLSQPGRVLLWALAVGVSLALASWLLGATGFAVKLQVYAKGEPHPTNFRLNLGYLSQLNYGPWYALVCPFVFYLAALSAFLTTRLGPESLRETSSLQALARTTPASVLAIVVFLAFIWNDVYAEMRAYHDMALGWVQSEQVQHWATYIRSTGHAFDITGSRFSYLDLPNASSDAAPRYVMPVKVLVDSVFPPTHRVPSHAGLLGFVGITKVWAAVWEGLVVYLAGLTFVWGLSLLPHIRRDTILALREEKAALWAEKPFCLLLYVGVLMNVFAIARFLANAAKGSFGGLDQWLSLVTLTPGIVTVVMVGLVVNRSFTVAPESPRLPVSAQGYRALGVWGISLLTLILLLLTYKDPAVYLPVHRFLCLLPIKACVLAGAQ